jgi:hypothetical protein
MRDLLGGQGMSRYAHLPTILEDWPEYDGNVVSDRFTKDNGATYVEKHSSCEWPHLGFKIWKK